jgi:N-acetylmuramoyl-L-alanine amidase
MKKFLVLLAVSALVLLQASCASSASANSVKLESGIRSLRIAIDPGHGGIDNGAIGTDTGVYESTLNLEISQLLAKQFMLSGADVLLTRKTTDVDYTGAGDTMKRRDMNSRAKLITAQDPQLLVSIHMNKYPNRKYSGAQVFYEKGSDESEKLATSIQDALNAGLGGSAKRLAKPGDYFILKVTKSPSVIVECGFLSNHDEEKKLLDPNYRGKLAECVYKGICAYLEIK